MTDEQIIAAIRQIDTPLGRVGLIHSREDGAVVPTYVAKQFAAAIAAQLAAPASEPTHEVLAEFLHSIGWRASCDAQWTNLRDALPKIRDLLAPQGASA